MELIRRPEVSVVIPTHNRWPLLSRALASVLGQVGPELEVLVVDDASVDETPDRLAAIDDPRVRVLRQDSNQGVSRARNRGIDAAAAPLIAFLDDDDFWAPERLREHVRLLDGSRAAWLYGPALAIGPEGKARNLLVAPSPRELKRALFRANVVGPPSTVTVRAELVRELGGFDERLSTLADWDLWIRLDRAAPAAVCATPLVAYCEHPENMQRTRRAGKVDELRYMADKHRRSTGRQPFGAATLEHIAVGDHRRAGRRVRAAIGYVSLGLRRGSLHDVLRGIALLGGEGLVARFSRRRRRRLPAPPWVLQGLGARASDSEPLACLSAAS